MLSFCAFKETASLCKQGLPLINAGFHQIFIGFQLEPCFVAGQPSVDLAKLIQKLFAPLFSGFRFLACPHCFRIAAHDQLEYVFHRILRLSVNLMQTVWTNIPALMQAA